MPLKRTPPKRPTVSETDTESVDGSVSDVTNTGNQSNANTGRLKRKRENELISFMEEMRDMFSNHTADQKTKLESLETFNRN